VMHRARPAEGRRIIDFFFDQLDCNVPTRSTSGGSANYY
jgi:hypothetical protein